MLAIFSVENFVFQCPIPEYKYYKILRTIILPVVLYGCGTCPLTPRQKHRLRLLKNMVLRTILGHTRNELTGVVKAT
jgi:hypothetical protein